MLIADLHIHGKYARGTSKNLNLKEIARFAKLKGLNLVGIGDIFHEKWVKEAREVLKGDEIYEAYGIHFVAAGEVNTVWEQAGKMRKVHHVIVFPSLENAMEFRKEIEKFGRWDDGRATLFMSAEDLALNLVDFDKDAVIFPAHAWTPWFGVFGSKSGFDSLHEAYGKAEKHIHAIETGLSSDPEMNYLVRELDSKAIISFSDAHSFWPHRLGREATAFDAELNYRSLIKAIKQNKVIFTIEVDPAYGKYHFDGHRKCGVVLSPEEAEKMGNICPVCGKPLTKGVLHRVYDIADRKKPRKGKPFFRIIPLTEIMAKVFGKTPTSRSILKKYFEVTREHNEIEILLFMDEKKIEKLLGKEVAGIIMKMRRNEAEVKPGYDGVYGELVLERRNEKKKFTTLLDFQS